MGKAWLSYYLLMIALILFMANFGLQGVAWFHDLNQVTQNIAGILILTSLLISLLVSILISVKYGLAGGLMTEKLGGVSGGILILALWTSFTALTIGIMTQLLLQAMLYCLATLALNSWIFFGIYLARKQTRLEHMA